MWNWLSRDVGAGSKDTSTITKKLEMFVTRWLTHHLFHLGYR